MTTLQDSAQKQLRQLIEQIERLEEEKRALAADIRDKYKEAKGVGFDVKVLRAVVALRRKSTQERKETDSVLAVYLHALGMADDFEAEAARYDMSGAAASDEYVYDENLGPGSPSAGRRAGPEAPVADVVPMRDFHPIARAREYPALGSSVG